MKKLGGKILIGLSLLSVITGSQFVFGPTAEAASCSNVSTFGSITLDVPTLPNDGSVYVWVRMQATNPSSKLYTEVNSNQCLVLQGENLSADNWSWQAYKQNGLPARADFGQGKSNTIKLIGVDDGVRVDRVLFTSNECVPQDFGDNCLEAATVQVNANEITKLESLDEPISGSYTLSNTPFDYSYILSELRYVADGKVIQKSETPQEFDTTRLENGKYTILIETELSDGNTIKESIVVNIKNPLNPLSPILRWAKINPTSWKIVWVSFLTVTCIMILLASFRHLSSKRKHRKFHGF